MSFIEIALEGQEKDSMEHPCEEDGKILLSTVVRLFSRARGLKYKSKESTKWRSLRVTDGFVISPEVVGWGSNVYFPLFLEESPTSDISSPSTQIPRPDTSSPSTQIPRPNISRENSNSSFGGNSSPSTQMQLETSRPVFSRENGNSSFGGNSFPTRTSSHTEKKKTCSPYLLGQCKIKNCKDVHNPNTLRKFQALKGRPKFSRENSNSSFGSNSTIGSRSSGMSAKNWLPAERDCSYFLKDKCTRKQCDFKHDMDRYRQVKSLPKKPNTRKPKHWQDRPPTASSSPTHSDQPSVNSSHTRTAVLYTVMETNTDDQVISSNNLPLLGMALDSVQPIVTQMVDKQTNFAESEEEDSILFIDVEVNGNENMECINDVDNLELTIDSETTALEAHNLNIVDDPAAQEDLNQVQEQDPELSVMQGTDRPLEEDEQPQEEEVQEGNEERQKEEQAAPSASHKLRGPAMPHARHHTQRNAKAFQDNPFLMSLPTHTFDTNMILADKMLIGLEPCWNLQPSTCYYDWVYWRESELRSGIRDGKTQAEREECKVWLHSVGLLGDNTIRLPAPNQDYRWIVVPVPIEEKYPEDKAKDNKAIAKANKAIPGSGYDPELTLSTNLHEKEIRSISELIIRVVCKSQCKASFTRHGKNNIKCNHCSLLFKSGVEPYAMWFHLLWKHNFSCM